MTNAICSSTGQAYASKIDESNDREDLSTFALDVHAFSLIRKQECEIIYDKIQSASTALRATHEIANRYAERNRYRNVLPYDQNLYVPRTLPSNFYYNASPIKMGEMRYIAAQGATRSSKDHFWEMVLDSDAELIITMTDENEGKRKKCMPYWRHLPKERVKLLKLTILMKREDQAILVRKFWDGKKHIRQIHFTGWRDGKTPNMILFSHFVDLIDRLHIKNNLPIVVHCSAGCGRTGVFIAAHSLLRHLETNPLRVNIAEWIYEMRRQRPKMVHGENQLLAVCEFIAEKISEKTLF